MALVQLITEA